MGPVYLAPKILDYTKKVNVLERVHFRLHYKYFIDPKYVVLKKLPNFEH